MGLALTYLTVGYTYNDIRLNHLNVVFVDSSTIIERSLYLSV